MTASIVMGKYDRHCPSLYRLQRLGLCCRDARMPDRTRVLEHRARPYDCMRRRSTADHLGRHLSVSAASGNGGAMPPLTRWRRHAEPTSGLSRRTLPCNSLNVVTRSTGVPLRVTDKGGFLRTEPNVVHLHLLTEFSLLFSIHMCPMSLSSLFTSHVRLSCSLKDLLT